VAKISELSMMPNPAVYRRANGDTYAKLNEAFHVKAIRKPDGAVIGNGTAEQLDPDEDVTVL
jgi:hypothetical protein